ncbi:MAG: AAA family ATPase [Candidatus Nanohaloarchaea archaeon]
MNYGVTGMPLAGKTTVAEILEKKGLEKIGMGDVVRKERKKRGIPVEKTGEWVQNLREEKGRDAIAELTVPYIEDEETAITGIRGLEEKKRFEEELGEMEIIAVWASPETRRKRREKRQRPEDVESESFEKRDSRELDQGVGNLIALSDHLIVNEGLSIEELEEEVNRIVN